MARELVSTLLRGSLSMIAGCACTVLYSQCLGQLGEGVVCFPSLHAAEGLRDLSSRLPIFYQMLSLDHVLFQVVS